MNQGTFIGFIVCTRRETGMLADHHVQLLRTFADQAVIAIENARLFNETKEALERQTATSEVLEVISASTGELAAGVQELCWITQHAFVVQTLAPISLFMENGAFRRRRLLQRATGLRRKICGHADPATPTGSTRYRCPYRMKWFT